MRPKRLISIVVLAGACLTGVAAGGLPWADASAHGAHVAKRPTKGKAHSAPAHGPCIRYDTDDTVTCLPHPIVGKRGARGARGARGIRGVRGVAGATGATGAVGAQGPAGPAGPKGVQGVQGIQGGPGAFEADGSDPGGNTIQVVGYEVGPLHSPASGTVLTPSVARCPVAGPDREAYTGGAIITTYPSASTPTPGEQTVGDVVGLESAFPGNFVSQSEVDPLPLGSSPGAVSSQAANAYQAQAVVGQMNSGDSVTVQAYVVCGP